MASLKLVKGIQLCVLKNYDGAAKFFLGAFGSDATQTLKDLKDLQGRAQRYSIDELEVLIGSGGLRELFHRFANESNRPWSLNDRTTFQQLFDGVPSKTGGKYRRKGISSFTASSGDIGNFARISTEAAEAVKVLNLESEIHAAYERIVKSCNPENYWELSDEELEEHYEKMGKINKAWEVLYMPFIQPSSRP